MIEQPPHPARAVDAEGRSMASGVSRRVLSLTTTLMFVASGVGIGSPAYADKIRDDQWHLKYLKIADAHRLSQGEGVIVAVVDGGVDNAHEDLRRNVLTGTDVVTGGNGNGFGDLDGHGTGMAGLIAAHGHGANGADGMLGIAPKAKILPIRIDTTPDELTGSTDAFAIAVDYAIKRKAKIMSVSLSGMNGVVALEAVQKAQRAGILVVAGAGNKPDDLLVAGPANLPGVLAVGATDQDGDLWARSTTGREVALAAPGVNIASTSRVDAAKNTKYRKGTGTSDSTAIVSGVAALVWSKYPDLTASEVAWRLTSTATDKGAPGRDQDYGYGIVNPVAALAPDVTPSPKPTQSPSFKPVEPGNESADTSTDGDGHRTHWLLGGLGLLTLVAVVATATVLIARRHRNDPSEQ